MPLTFYRVRHRLGHDGLVKSRERTGTTGNHTMHHCNADGTGCFGGQTVPATAAAAELDDCTADLQATYGLEAVYSMAAPYGDGNWAQHASTRFLVNRGVNDLPGGVAPNAAIDPFNLPCHLGPANETAVGGLNNVTDSVRTKSRGASPNHSSAATAATNPIDLEGDVRGNSLAKGRGTLGLHRATKSVPTGAAEVDHRITPTTSGPQSNLELDAAAQLPAGK